MLAACLVISSVDVPVKAEQEINGEKYYNVEEATNIIDNLIVEGEGIEDSHFEYQYLQDNPLCDAALWIKKLNYTNVGVLITEEQYKDAINPSSIHFYEGGVYYYVGLSCWANINDSNQNNKYRYLAVLYVNKIRLAYGFGQMPIVYLYNLMTSVKEHNTVECYIWELLYDYTPKPNTYITETFNNYYMSYYYMTYGRESWLSYTDEKLDNAKKLLIESFEIMLQEAEEPYLDTSPTAGVDISNMIDAMKKAASYKKTSTTKKTSSTSTNTTSKTGAKTSSKIVKSLNKVTNVKLSSKKKQIKVKWTNVVNAKSYEIQVARNKKFKNATVIKTKKTSKTIKKLKSKKIYYVRIRAINGKVKSKWVKKNIKTK